MAVDYDEDGLDVLDFERSSTVGYVNVVKLESGKKQSRYFETRFRASSRTRESVQA